MRGLLLILKCIVMMPFSAILIWFVDWRRTEYPADHFIRYDLPTHEYIRDHDEEFDRVRDAVRRVER